MFSIKMSFAAPFEEGTFQHLVILPDFKPGEIVTVKERARCRYGAVHRLGNIHRRKEHKLVISLFNNLSIFNFKFLSHTHSPLILQNSQNNNGIHNGIRLRRVTVCKTLFLPSKTEYTFTFWNTPERRCRTVLYVRFPPRAEYALYPA